MSDPFDTSGLTENDYVDSHGYLVREFYNSDGFFAGVTFDHQDGSGTWQSADGNHGSWSSETWFWDFGATLGLGFEVWGTSAGDGGFSWTSGLGFIAEAGQAHDAQDALSQVNTQTTTDVAVDVDPRPSWIHFNSDGTVVFDNVGVDFAIRWIDHDQPYDGGARTLPREDGAPTQEN